MTLFPVFAGGRLHPAGTPLIPVEAEAVQLGCAVFETWLLEAGRFPFGDLHLQRLERSVHALGWSWPPDATPRAALAAFAQALELERAGVRLTVAQGADGSSLLLGNARVLEPLDPEHGAGIDVELAPGLLATHPASGLKLSSRMSTELMRRGASDRGAREVLFANEHGELVEGSFTNLLALCRGAWVTPPTESGALPGIVRERLLESELVRAERLPVAALAEVQELALSNSLRGVVPVRALRSGETRRELPGSRGSGFRRLAAAWRRACESERETGGPGT